MNPYAKNTQADPKETIPAAQLPPAWRAQHTLHQLRVLIVAGIALLLVSWRSPIMEPLLDAIPELETPWGFPLPTRYLIPLTLPLVLGIPLALTRYRAPLILWVGLATVLATTGVLEVARLNWVAFAGGVAFRVESGPVPLVRSIAGLALVLCGVLLMAQQSAHHHIALLAERGVPRNELTVVRRRLLRWEHIAVAGAFAAGTLLILITAISMQLTERAPSETSRFLPAVVWVGALLAVIATVIAYLARDRTES